MEEPDIIFTPEPSDDDDGGMDGQQPLGDMLAGDMAELLRHAPEEGYWWADTQTALVEVCHIVWSTGRLHDASGRKLPFRGIVRAACRALHVSEPRNPSAVVAQARRRKDVRLGSLTARYELLRRQGVRDPFRLDVRRKRGGKPQ